MKPLRLLLLAAGILAVAVVAVVALAFTSSAQTWLVRKMIAARPALNVSVGEISAGIRRVELKDVRYEIAGAVLTLPALEAEVPLMPAGMKRQVDVFRLVAHGWTLDLSRAAAVGTAAAPLPAVPGLPTTEKIPLPESALRAFAGIFSQLELPADVSIDGVDVDGTVVLPETRGRVHVKVQGGGFGAGREGRFDVSAEAALAGPDVRVLAVQGRVAAAMDTSRTFTRLGVVLKATARGDRFPAGVELSSDLAATRTAAGESYAVAIVAAGKEMLRIKAEFPRGSPSLDGTWKIDVRDTEVAPFALGKPLPGFWIVGGGTLSTNAVFSIVRAAGRLEITADRLEVVRRELQALGPLRIAGDFDLAGQEGSLAVRKLAASVAALTPSGPLDLGGAPTAVPIATVRALQAFDFNPRSGVLRAAEAERELVGVVLEAVPVAWVRPFLPNLALDGGMLRGELAASPRGGGFAVRSVRPISVDRVALELGGRPALRGLDVSLGVTADYTPQGWQVEVAGCNLTCEGRPVLTLDARAGQLAGRDQPLKTTGKLSARLPEILRQPAAAGLAALTEGEAGLDFVASLGARQEIQAKIDLHHLAVGAEGKREALPSVAGEVRADVAADGGLGFNAPLTLTRDDRRSDVTLAGRIGPVANGRREIEARLTSAHLVVDDARLLAALVPERAPAAGGPGKNSVPAGPPWAGWHGTVAFQFQRITYSDTLEANQVSGRVRLEAGMVKLEGAQARLGDGGRAEVSGAVTYSGESPLPFALAADVAVREFDPAPWFQAFQGRQPATVEGRFDVTSKVNARGASVAALGPGVGGDFRLTSRGGIFRGLPVNVGRVADQAGKGAGWLASAGSALSSITGRKEQTDLASKAQAVAELARALNPISYDQLSVVVTRDAALNTTLRDFSLISPEFRLTGSGSTLHRADTGLLEDSLAMEFQLRARGRQGELLRYLGLLEAQPDPLGYSICALPLRVGGTLGRPDTQELNSRLLALAMEKSGVTEKAADLFNKVFGGGK